MVACLAVAIAAASGCDATSRYRMLTTIFDGVPPPETVTASTDAPGAGADATTGRRTAVGTHGPYAAKMCDACHASASRGALVAPREELCFRCHELAAQKRYVHGPLASGGCTACHDPHSSRYRYLLIAESDSFCTQCHDPRSIAGVSAHADAADNCTTCHDAHMSDKKYLLR